MILKDSKDRVRRMLLKQHASIKEETPDSIVFVPDLNKGMCPPMRIRLWDDHVMFITDLRSDIPERAREKVSSMVHDFNKRHSEGVLDYDSEDGQVWIRTWERVGNGRRFGPRDLEYHIRLAREISSAVMPKLFAMCALTDEDAVGIDGCRPKGDDPSFMYGRTQGDAPAVGANHQSGGGIPLRFCGGSPVFDGSSFHTVIIGSTGAGKTHCLIIPTCLSIVWNRESFVVEDPKGEIEGILDGELRRLGYEVHRLDARDPYESDRVGLLSEIYDKHRSGDITEVADVTRLLEDMAAVLMDNGNPEDRYWIDLASRLFVGCAQLLLRGCDREDFTLGNIYALKTVFETNDHLMKALLDSMPSNLPERRNISGTVVNAENTRRCILSFFDRGLLPYISNPGVSSILSKGDFSASDAGFRPMAVFLRIPDESKAYDGIVSMYVSMVYSEMIRRAHAESDGRLPVRMNFILDELANLPTIPDLDKKICISRSRNIRFTIVLQSKRQLEASYGPAAMDVIMNNCGNIVCMANRDLGLLREICEMADLDGVTPKILSRMPSGRALVIHGGDKPYVTDLPTWEAYGIVPGADVKRPRREPDPEREFDPEDYIYGLIAAFEEEDEEDTADQDADPSVPPEWLRDMMDRIGRGALADDDTADD